jgi:hypothetical protein
VRLIATIAAVFAAGYESIAHLKVILFNALMCPSRIDFMGFRPPSMTVGLQ